MPGMKKILIVLACVVGVALALTVAGMFLPQNHVASRTATIAASPERVFAAISDVDAYMRWRSNLHAVEKLPDDGKGTRFVEKSGDGEILFRVEVLEPNTRMVTRIADPDLPFGGSWTFDLKPSGAGTDLTITEAGEVYNVFFRTMQKLFFPPTKTIDAYLDDLKKHLANQ
jgi:uncharacterized protein YndB with AHSA1/START domain